MARILLVDTSITARLRVVKDLEEDGHHVAEITSGQEALDICTSEPPDCIILELVLQDIDGFKVLRTLKEKNLNIPTIVLTDLRMKSLEEKCLELGVAAYLRKPIRPSVLKEKIDELLKDSKIDEAAKSARAKPQSG